MTDPTQDRVPGRVWFSGIKSVHPNGPFVSMPAGWYEPVKTEDRGGSLVTTYRQVKP